jgi:hypothetical protein
VAIVAKTFALEGVQTIHRDDGRARLPADTEANRQYAEYRVAENAQSLYSNLAFGPNHTVLRPKHIARGGVENALNSSFRKQVGKGNVENCRIMLKWIV